MDAKLVKVSKFLSLVLRHQPQTIGLTLDEQGWADVDDLIARANRHRMPLDTDLLETVVANCEKKRFAFSDDGRRIRANQGHSVEVNLGLQPVEPPTLLYHGTARHSLDSIRQTGLNPRSRQQVHLSADTPTAIKVGQRHGKPVVLIVQSKAMQAAGHAFYRADNGVWLVDAVPVEFLTFPE